MKGLLKVFDLNRPSYEVDSYELKYMGKRQKKPISSIHLLSENTVALGCHSGDSVYLLDQRNLIRSAQHSVQLPC